MLKVDHPFSLVLFGASGNLARIKIYPALYYLALKGRLPADYAVVGFSRTRMSDGEFKSFVSDSVGADAGEVNEGVLKEFLNHLSYHAGGYDAPGDFIGLKNKLMNIEAGWPETVRLAYLSIPPSAFASTLKNICSGGISDPKKGFRCIVEKPVGQDLKSFEEIKTRLDACFKSEEIFILDHYLGKEAVRNVYYLRYANPVIERLLKNTLINNVQIVASESRGLDGRSGYFDAVGTLRDMFQSHLIEMASLLTMRLGDAGQMKASRLDAVRKFYIPPASDLSQIIFQGQYAAGAIGRKDRAGYRQETGISADSRTPTFAAMKLMTRSSRWEGVPFFLRSGKRLKAKETRITIEFQDSPPLLGAPDQRRNRLDIILQGEAGLKLHLQTKLGGSEPKFRPLVLEDPLVCMGDCLPEHSLLLLEAVNGHRQWFLDPEEVRACWHLIDPLQKFLQESSTPLHFYPAGSPYPREADEFIRHQGHEWF
ncbi:hypothetical protein A3A67_04190 [Candidatus Peribacteria bacterium RIFCSPLOWO2_01_FULL_51_18]|nr:MAG: hypothetical protein A3A67_04190 [Candidatus Peribacteria bacterium RIFCSPLOWO2_01_FULL_51_18]